MTRVQRFMKLREIGCIHCRLLGWFNDEVDIHHIVDRGYRRLSGGDAATIPLCAWAHRGHCNEGMTVTDMRLRFGPSLFHHKKAFIERFGTERELLAKVNGLIRLNASTLTLNQASA